MRKLDSDILPNESIFTHKRFCVSRIEKYIERVTVNICLLLRKSSPKLDAHASLIRCSPL